MTKVIKNDRVFTITEEDLPNIEATLDSVSPYERRFFHRMSLYVRANDSVIIEAGPGWPRWGCDEIHVIDVREARCPEVRLPAAALERVASKGLLANTGTYLYYGGSGRTMQNLVEAYPALGPTLTDCTYEQVIVNELWADSYEEHVEGNVCTLRPRRTTGDEKHWFGFFGDPPFHKERGIVHDEDESDDDQGDPGWKGYFAANAGEGTCESSTATPAQLPGGCKRVSGFTADLPEGKLVGRAEETSPIYIDLEKVLGEDDRPSGLPNTIILDGKVVTIGELKGRAKSGTRLDRVIADSIIPHISEYEYATTSDEPQEGELVIVDEGWSEIILPEKWKDIASCPAEGHGYYVMLSEKNLEIIRERDFKKHQVIEQLLSTLDEPATLDLSLHITLDGERVSARVLRRRGREGTTRDRIIAAALSPNMFYAEATTDPEGRGFYIDTRQVVPEARLSRGWRGIAHFATRDHAYVMLSEKNLETIRDRDPNLHEQIIEALAFDCEEG